MLTADPAVPQRDALLDEVAVACVLGAPVERVHAKYRVGESLRVVYRIGSDRHAAARSYRDGASAAAYERALGSAVPAHGPPVIHAPELDAVFWTFPNDRRISALPVLTPGSPALARLLGRPCAATRLVAYAAERSASAECRDERGRVLAYVKVHAGDGAEREHRALESLAGAHVPRVLAASSNVLALEPLDGRRVDTLEGSELEAALRALGATLAELHATAPRPKRRFTRLDPDRLARAAAVIARARPEAGRPAALLLADLLERPLGGAPTVCLHGDANLRNAIVDGGKVALVDLEDVGAGPAAADLGQLLAGLLTARVLGRISATAERGLAGCLIDGYANPPDRESLRWHTAASVLARVALPAVSRVRPRLLARLVPLLGEARP